MMMKELLKDHCTTTISKDLFKLIVGTPIGEGSFRKVFSYLPNTDYVIKFEENAKCFSNIMEWETWNEVKYTKHAKWFAPCIDISDCGTILIQEKTVPLGKLPTKIPKYFRDVGRDNFGTIKGKVVCHDYGIHDLLRVGLTDEMQEITAREWL